MTSARRRGIIYGMKGLIIINAYWRAACVTEQAERLREELIAQGAEADIMRNGFLPVGVGRQGIVNEIIGKYDFCIYLDKDKYVSELLEKSGMRLFNRHEAVRLCDDKMRTYAALAAVGLPVPRTIPAPLCYTAGSTAREDVLGGAERRLGYPMIVKTSYGSGGKGVYKADCRADLDGIENELLYSPHMYQEYIRGSAGRDVRAIVIGGRCIGAMLRTSDGKDFRSNIAAGGRGEKYELGSDGARLAECAALAVGAEYAGVDLLFGDDGFIVCEVNSNAFFGGFESAVGINVAGEYARYVTDAVKRGL